MDIKVTVAGRTAPQLDQLVTEELVMPLALMGCALGLDACWDADTATLHLASPLQGRLMIIDVASRREDGPPGDDEVSAGLEDLGCILAGLLRRWGAQVVLRTTGDGDPHGGECADIHLLLRPGPEAGGDGLPGPAARWGWAESLLSRAWARTLVDSIAGHLDLAPRGVRAQLRFWRPDYPSCMRWGGHPAVILEPANAGSQAGKKLLSRRQFRVQCAEGIVRGLSRIFSRYLPAASGEVGAIPGIVDYRSLGAFWNHEEQQPSARAEPDPAPASRQAVPPASTMDAGRGPGAGRHRGKVREIDRPGKSSPSHSSLAALVKTKGSSDLPALPAHMTGDIFAAVGRQVQGSTPRRKRRA